MVVSLDGAAVAVHPEHLVEAIRYREISYMQ